ncbi:MAG: ABC transporter permease subunit [Alphaproteobacteria bacterium]|nr:ABC transporter permease subunit [Alphaproteobacteria bacterium]
MIRMSAALRLLPLWLILAFGLVFLLSPLFVIFVMSIDAGQPFRFAFPPRQPSLTWYAAISQVYWEAFLRTLWLAGLTAVIATTLGTMAAIGLVRGNVIGRTALEAFFRLPLQIPFVVTGVTFLQFYYGYVDIIGANLAGTMAGIVIALVFVGIPYSIGTVSAVLVRLAPDHEEAAAVLGATPWSCFRRVTFPLLRPGIVAGLLFSFIVAFGDIPVVVFLAGRDTLTIPVAIFQALQYDFTPTIFAISTVVVLFSLVLILLLRKLAGLQLILPSGAN